MMKKRIKFYIQVPTDIQHIQQIFKENGYNLYLVGGSVRDALLNNKMKDYDLVTDAVPDKVEEIMNKSGFKTLATGKAFGVINVFTDKNEYEIATFRGESYSDKDKRRPETVYFSDIETDSLRRDLTFNALYYDIETKEIIDLVGGYSDIKKGIIKTVGKAEDRFNEDKLRILRVIRFSARFGSNINDETDLALIKDSNLEGISGERIRDEFIKGLSSAKSTKNYLELVDRYNLFDWIFKGLIIDKRFIDNDKPIVLISMLLNKNNSSVLSKKLNELKYSSDEIRKITTLISMLELDIETAPKLKKLFIKSGLSIDELKDFGSNMWMSIKLLDYFEKYLKSPNITGEEAMNKYKIEKPGIELGKAINEMEIQLFLKLFKF